MFCYKNQQFSDMQQSAGDNVVQCTSATYIPSRRVSQPSGRPVNY